MPVRRLLTALPALAFATFAASADAAAPIAGRFVTPDGAAVVTVGPCGGAVCGRLSGVLKIEPGRSPLDVNNSDPALRTRPMMGLPILIGLVDKGKDWRGQIYDPRNGKTYKSIVSRNADGSLNVQGCVAFFCQTQVWPKAK